MQDIETTIISPYMIKTFKECPLKFYYKYIKQIQTPALDKNFQTGKNIHALASYYLKGNDIEKLETALTPNEQNLWSNLKSCPYIDYEIVAVEKSISLKLDKYWIGGRIDSIVKNNSDYYILDYKTGDIKEDMTYDPQTMIYCLMSDELIKTYNKLTFIYLNLKTNSEIKIEFTKDLKTEYKKKLIDICEKIANFNSQKFTTNQNCECEYSKICDKKLPD